MISFNAKYGAGVKSVQRGVFTPSVDVGSVVTITAVNPAKTVVFACQASFLGQASSWNTPQIGAVLESATQLRVIGASSPVGGGGAQFTAISWQVVEFL